MKHIDDVSREVEMNTLKSIGFELVHDATGQGPLWKNTLAAELQARISRYETAMREALRILERAGRYRDVEAILRAALSDQPDRPDNNIICACGHKALAHSWPQGRCEYTQSLVVGIIRKAGEDSVRCLCERFATPAEEPAESKLEAPTLYCHAQPDGECTWVECPQLNPLMRETHCPLDTRFDDES